MQQEIKLIVIPNFMSSVNIPLFWKRMLITIAERSDKINLEQFLSFSTSHYFYIFLSCKKLLTFPDTLKYASRNKKHCHCHTLLYILSQ
jgi:hypothetical protein